jgi:hypothetical protein
MVFSMKASMLVLSILQNFMGSLWNLYGGNSNAKDTTSTDILSNTGMQRLDTATKIILVRNSPQYLVGDLSRWNNAKRAEEKDRVKHG